MTNLPRYWFSVVSALPDPEAIERVNVAIAVGDYNRVRIHYLNDLPKLACLVSPNQVKVFRAVLAGLAERVRTPEDYFLASKTLGPHFHVEAPRELYHPPDSSILRLLADRYLQVHKGEKKKAVRKSVQRIASKRLDILLTETLPMGAIVEKVATVDRLYPKLAPAGVFSAEVPRLNRAVRFSDVDILIGSIVVEDTGDIDPLEITRDAAARISQAFWQYSQARSIVRTETGRDLKTLGIIFNGSSDRPEVVSAKRFVRHLWEADADKLLAPEHSEEEKELVEALEELATR